MRPSVGRQILREDICRLLIRLHMLKFGVSSITDVLNQVKVYLMGAGNMPKLGGIPLSEYLDGGCVILFKTKGFLSPEEQLNQIKDRKGFMYQAGRRRYTLGLCRATRGGCLLRADPCDREPRGRTNNHDESAVCGSCVIGVGS